VIEMEVAKGRKFMKVLNRHEGIEVRVLGEVVSVSAYETRR